MGEEILHPDRQPAGAAQQGEGGETSPRWRLSICLLAFIGEGEGSFLHLPFIPLPNPLKYVLMPEVAT